MSTWDPYANAVQGTTGTTWTNTSNLIGSGLGSAAVWTNATANATGTIEARFDMSAIPANAIINNVTVTVRGWVGNVSRMIAPQGAVRVGSTVIGSTVTLSNLLSTTTTSSQSFSPSTLPTAAQLRDATFNVLLTARKASSSQSSTTNFDAVDVLVDYTVPVDATFDSATGQGVADAAGSQGGLWAFAFAPETFDASLPRDMPNRSNDVVWDGTLGNPAGSLRTDGDSGWAGASQRFTTKGDFYLSVDVIANPGVGTGREIYNTRFWFKDQGFLFRLDTDNTSAGFFQTPGLIRIDSGSTPNLPQDTWCRLILVGQGTVVRAEVWNLVTGALIDARSKDLASYLSPGVRDQDGWIGQGPDGAWTATGWRVDNIITSAPLVNGYQGVWFTPGGSPSPVPGVSIGIPTDTRVVIVAAMGREVGLPTAISVGSTALTKISEQAGQHGQAWWWGVVPASEGAVADITWTWSDGGNTSARNCYVWVIEPTPGATLSVHDSNYTAITGSNQSQNVDITAVDGGWVMGAAFGLDAGSVPIRFTGGLTERWHTYPNAAGDTQATATGTLTVTVYGGAIVERLALLSVKEASSPDATFAATSAGNSSADGGSGSLVGQVNASFAATTAADAPSSGGTGALTGAASFVATGQGLTPADTTGTLSLTGGAGFAATTASTAPADGGVGSLTSSGTFASTGQGTATADTSGTGSLTGTATFSTVAADAVASTTGQGAMTGTSGATFAALGTGDAAADGGVGTLQVPDAFFRADTSGDATADGNQLVLGVTYVTVAGDAPAVGGSVALTGGATFAATGQALAPAGTTGTGAMSGSAAFSATMAGDATADGAVGALSATAGATLSTSVGDAPADGGTGLLAASGGFSGTIAGTATADTGPSGALVGGATFAGTTAADASAGTTGTGSMNGSASFAANAAGTSTADGGVGGLAGSAVGSFITTPSDATADGNTGQLLAPDATFGTLPAAAQSDGGTGSFTGTVSVSMTFVPADASAGGNAAVWTGSATLGTVVGNATGAGNDGALLGGSGNTFTTSVGVASADGLAGALAGAAVLETLASAAAVASGGTLVFETSVVWTTVAGTASASGGDGALSVGASYHVVSATMGGRRVGAVRLPGRVIVSSIGPRRTTASRRYR